MTIRAPAFQPGFFLPSSATHPFNMRSLFFHFRLQVICFAIASYSGLAQGPGFRVHAIKLPEDVAYYDNQFSGLQVYQNRLYLLAESRLQEKATAKLCVAGLGTLRRSLKDTGRALSFSTYPIHDLDKLREKIRAAGGDYEGLEAMTIEDNTIYFSVETATPSPDCYLLRGRLNESSVQMDTGFMVAIPKFTGADGKAIYNAGYEAMTWYEGDLYTFYEYNYFPSSNYVRVLDKFSFTGNQCQHFFPIQKLPFRITDITATGGNRFTALNFFFKGDGEDAVYRPDAGDSLNNSLVRLNGSYKSYARLVSLLITDTGIRWEPLWEFPENLQGHNWEGIAAYRNGYFVMNDKYTTTRPNRTVLLYLEKTGR